jgi:hypothetical protein
VPDEVTVRVLVHRQNIHRYRYLLATQLTDIERAFIERRIAEEEAEVSRLNALRWDNAVDPAKTQAARAGDDRLTRLPTADRSSG